ncbi:hypothetical protein CEXT_701241 [Caerostris extrusa]|uniref:Uncharacterized protein n=1 Tax=Caerostris extrusa TaxID=172846 RepID=A0AAV4U6K2_CAEEX|nr:hypothetical protein CEXT_701241 [Caerostris extrusa]
MSRRHVFVVQVVTRRQREKQQTEFRFRDTTFFRASSSPLLPPHLFGTRNQLLQRKTKTIHSPISKVPDQDQREKASDKFLDDGNSRITKNNIVQENVHRKEAVNEETSGNVEVQDGFQPEVDAGSISSRKHGKQGQKSRSRKPKSKSPKRIRKWGKKS